MSLHSIQFPDVFPTLSALLVTLVLLTAFGWAAGQATNLFQFRSRRFSFQLILAIPLASALLPALLYFVARFTSVGAAAITLGTVVIASAVTAVVLVSRRGLPQLSRAELLWGTVVLLGTLVAAAELSQITFNDGVRDRLLLSMVVGDHKKHTLITEAILQTGVPPLNPAYHVGEPTTVSYYYFWALLAAVVAKLNPAVFINARYGYFGVTTVTWVLVASLIVLYLRLTRGSNGILTRAWIGVGLLLVTGLDLLATYGFYAGGISLYGAVDDWNWSIQYTSWHSAMLWTPQHIVGMVACIMALLVFRETEHPMSRGTRQLHYAITAIMLVSAAGISVWVTLVFALFWGAYTGVMLIGRKPERAAQLIFVGVTAVVIALPYLFELLGRQSSNFPISIDLFTRHSALYRLIVLDDTLDRVTRLGIAAGLVPIVVFLEMGFVLVSAFIYWRYIAPKKPSRDHIVEVILLVAGLLVAWFVRSTILANDLGWRAYLFVQFVLLIWSVDVVLELLPRIKARFETPLNVFTQRRLLKLLVMALLIIGVSGVLYDLVGLHVIFNATYPLRTLEDGRDTIAYIEANTPPDAVVQINPVPAHGYTALYMNRPTWLVDLPHSLVFGTSREDAYQARLTLGPIFYADFENSVETTASLCRELGIDYLFISALDTIWGDSTGWMWEVEPWYETPTTRVYSCDALNSGISGVNLP